MSILVDFFDDACYSSLMDEVTPSELNTKLQDDIKKVTSYLNQIANYRYHLLIYKLVKNGHVKIKDLVEDCGYSKQNIYNIVDTFDSKVR